MNSINNHETTAQTHLMDEVFLKITLSSGLAASKWEYQHNEDTQIVVLQEYLNEIDRLKQRTGQLEYQNNQHYVSVDTFQGRNS